MSEIKTDPRLFSIPVKFTYQDFIFVEADSLEEAIETAKNSIPKMEESLKYKNYNGIVGDIHYKDKTLEIDTDKLKEKHPEWH